MASRGLGLEQARRQRWLMGLAVAGLSVTVVVVAVTLWLSNTNKEVPVRLPPSPAADVHQQVSGYTFTRSNEGRTLFSVHAARTVAFQGGKNTVLEDVVVEFFGRQGSHHNILRTHHCQYNADSGNFVSPGRVELELNAESSELPGAGLQGKHTVYLETSKVSYRQQGSQAETDEPVKFRIGPATGTAAGLVYATSDGWLELKHQVAISMDQGRGHQPIRLTATSLRYDRNGGTVSLKGPVQVDQGGQHASADSARIALDDRNHVTQGVAEGNVQGRDTTGARNLEIEARRVQGDFDPASGQLRHLTAEDDVTCRSKSQTSVSRLGARRLDLDMGGVRAHPERGVVRGDVHLTVESEPVLKASGNAGAPLPGPEKKDLAASALRFSFRPDGKSLQDAVTEGTGTLLIKPGDPKVGERVITAGQLQMAFDARSRLEAMQGLKPTHVLFRPPASAPPGSVTQESTADHLDALFDTGTQTLREVKQSGNFEYRGGERQASSAEAHYDARSQNLLLLGHPQVWDATTRVRSQRVTFDTASDTATGEGQVQAVHLPASPTANSGRTAAENSAAPSPTNVLADRMVARRRTQMVHYEGHVRAWQGADVVESTALDIFRNERRLSSGSQVVTSYMCPAQRAIKGNAAPAGKDEMEPVTVSADSLDYLDQGRRAHYHGNVRMVTQDTTLQADRLDVFFAQGSSVEGSQVDRAEADGHVKVTQPGRQGLGNHGEYFAGPGKLILTGGPPSLFDAEKGSTTGQRLTFYTHDDRLDVDGGEKSPSLTEHRVAH